MDLCDALKAGKGINAPRSLYLMANARRGTTAHGTRRDRTLDETRSNAGGRSLKSLREETARSFFSVCEKGIRTLEGEDAVL